MKIGVIKEIHVGEKRVATTPEVTEKLIKLGFEVIVETGAGIGASFSDDAYKQAGAEIGRTAQFTWQAADVVIKVRPPEANLTLGQHEIELMPMGCHLVCFLWPAQNEKMLKQLAARQITALSMDSIPRISRAQKLDALSSMANIAGYRAVIEASAQFGRFFAGQITAAGKVAPAKVMVIGAGVAGLSAIGTAKSLGAIVRAFDTRPEVKEQIQSMDAEFLELEFEEDGTGEGGYAKVMSKEFIDAEMALFAEQAKDVDIIITTALIPGKPAPKLVTKAMIESMRDGSVVVDLAAEQGGNCELTVPGKIVNRHGVHIVGYTDLPSRLAAQSSQLYATNIYNLLEEMSPEKDGVIVVDMEDVVVRGATVVNRGEITWPPPPIAVSAGRKPSFGGQSVVIEPEAVTAVSPISKAAIAAKSPWLPMLIGGMALFGLGLVAPPSFMAHFTVFVLSCFIGYMVIWNVSPSLHTPLMSVTNAISSIIVLGALTQISSDNNIIMLLSVIALFITSINIVGGFSVTQRMLQMFKG
ncbi:MAG: NAD(P) transhydrogenase subunit alpha [Gammaproteobacteria bacterium]|jgi:NAD(P) transhydrogenase subunit alpha